MPIAPSIEIQTRPAAPAHRRSIVNLLANLEEIAAQSPNLVANHEARFEVNGEQYDLPRYLFVGPRGGDVPIRLGILPGCTVTNRKACTRWCASSDYWRPARNWRGAITCSLSNLQPDGTGGRHPLLAPRAGFEPRVWRNSDEPEVRLLEAELQSRSFQGLIALHTDDSSAGFYGFARGALLTKNLIEPALRAAEKYLPRNENAVIDGFNAKRGVIRGSYPGILTAPPRLRPRPFEIILETPAAPPVFLKELALVAALQTILIEYNKFIAYAPNL